MVSIELGISATFGEPSHIRNTGDFVSLKRRKEVLHGAGARTESINSFYICHLTNGNRSQV